MSRCCVLLRPKLPKLTSESSHRKRGRRDDYVVRRQHLRQRRLVRPFITTQRAVPRALVHVVHRERLSRLRVRAPAQRRRFDPFPGERSFHRLLQRLHRLHPLAGAFRLLRLSRLDALRLGRPRGLRLHPRSCLRSRLRRIFRRRLRRERRVAELGRLLRPLRPPDSLPPLRRLPSLTIRVRLLGRADSPGVVGLGRGARRDGCFLRCFRECRWRREGEQRAVRGGDAVSLGGHERLQG
mmetsp:Transcript_8422/g.37981  ORF Transcript_8422/g.37981 Transcript_8422/m.37981 type:complete len:239 (+) Transcript_8422:116-832(+)